MACDSRAGTKKRYGCQMTHEQESIYSVTQEQDGLSQQPKVELKNCFRFWSHGKILIKSKISGFLYHDDHDDHDDNDDHDDHDT